jgi:hypothetical protein
MITAILNVDTVKGSGSVTFDAITDGAANEVVSTSLEGQRFSASVQGNAAAISGSIQHTQSGMHTLTVRAETSNVQSNPELLDL